tara:strand:- start:447 stop:650 length:204 start_codon:yes stop_codon:yes gene_type:complete
MSDKTEFINFLTTSLNNEGYIVADKLEILYAELKAMMDKNKLVLKPNVQDDLFFLKFCYLIYKNKEA